MSNFQFNHQFFFSQQKKSTRLWFCLLWFILLQHQLLPITCDLRPITPYLHSLPSLFLNIQPARYSVGQSKASISETNLWLAEILTNISTGSDYKWNETRLWCIRILKEYTHVQRKLIWNFIANNITSTCVTMICPWKR